MNEITMSAATAPAEEAKPKRLSQKIVEIAEAVEKIKRTGRNKDQGYDYVTIEDVVDATRKLMAERKLVLTASMAKMERITHTKGYIMDVIFEWTLEDAETGEKRVWMIPGSGWDYNDKGIFKAMTGSRKYATILIFNLPIGDNPESSTGGDRRIAKATAGDIAQRKITEAALRGSETALDALSQVEPERKIHIDRPEEHHGNFIIVTGLIALPALEQFFDVVSAKRFKTKKDLVPYWRVPSEYEKDLMKLCERLKIEVEG